MHKRLLVFLIAGGLLGLALLAVWGVQEFMAFSRQQELDKVARLIESGRFEEAHRRLSWHLERRPEDAELLTQRAQLLALAVPAAAPEAWQHAYEADPENAELAVALGLSLLRNGDLATARQLLQSLPEDTAPAVRHRMGLSVSFAEGNNAEAFHHANALRELDPASPVHRLNLARISLLSVEAERREAARTTLWELSARPAYRDDCLLALAQDALRHSSEKYLNRVLAALRQEETTSERLLLALQVESRAGRLLAPAALDRAWQVAAAHPFPGPWLELITWLNAEGMAAEVINRLPEEPPLYFWRYPFGLAVAESALATNQPERVRAAILEADWGPQDPLRALLLARLYPEENARQLWLQRTAIDPRIDPMGARSLRAVATRWGWLRGQLHLAESQLARGPIPPAELAPLFATLEENGRTRDLLELTELQLRHLPENAILLNNAAYFAALLGKHLEQARTRIEKALDQRPEFPSFHATAALIAFKQADTQRMEENLEAQPDAPEMSLARALWYQSKGENLPESLRKALKQREFHLPEERSLRDNILK